MKQKQIQELKNKPTAELAKDLLSLRERLGRLKFDLAAGKVKNIREIKEIKKQIARILTTITQRDNS